MIRKTILLIAALVLGPAVLSGCGQATPEAVVPTEAVVGPALSEPSPTFTLLPPTPTPAILAVEDTPVPPTATSAPVAGTKLPSWCVDALTITLGDVGKRMCVGGSVLSAEKLGTDYLVRFAEADDSFRMIGFGWTAKYGVKSGQCVYAEGRIEQRGSAPVMSVTEFSLKACPSAEPTPPPPAGLPADCVYALDVTPLDVGKAMCIGGVVDFAGGNSKEYHIYFYKDREIGASFVIYGMKTSDRGVNPGDCIFVRNKKVARLGSALLVVINPGNIEFCSA